MYGRHRPEERVLTVHRQVLRTKEACYKPMLVNRLKTSRRKSGIHTKTVPMPDHLLEAINHHEARYRPLPAETVLWTHGRTIETCRRGPAKALFRWRTTGIRSTA